MPAFLQSRSRAERLGGFLCGVKAFPGGNSPEPRQDSTRLGQVEQREEQDELYAIRRVCLLEVLLHGLVVF